MAACIAKAAGDSAAEAQSALLRAVIDRKVEEWRQSITTKLLMQDGSY
jgi:hypothetical protein